MMGSGFRFRRENHGPAAAISSSNHTGQTVRHHDDAWQTTFNSLPIHLQEHSYSLVDLQVLMKRSDEAADRGAPLCLEADNTSGRDTLLPATPNTAMIEPNSNSVAPAALEHQLTVFSGGHVTCGVCGSRRYVPEPDLCYKFGSWICVHCIKFVLTTLKQASLAPTCLQDKEICRTHADKSELKLAPPDERCQACWLSACLNALNFSKAQHNRLRSSLPRAQRARVPLFSEKRRRETGSCEYGPLATAAQPVMASTPLASCPDRTWGGEATPDPVGFQALSPPSAIKDEPEESVREDLKESVKEELEEYVTEDLEKSVTEELEEYVTEELEESVTEELEESVTEELEEYVTEELEESVKEELEESVRKDLEELVKEEPKALADEPAAEVQTNTSEIASQEEAEDGAAQEAPEVAGDGKYKCGWRNFSTDHVRSHNWHRLEHMGKRPHSCDNCGKAFVKLCNLRRHRLSVHTDHRPYSCDVCGKAFKLNRLLVKHTLAHTRVDSRKAMAVVSLGGGWKRREFVRNGGRLDSVVSSPDGIGFRSIVELQPFLHFMGITRKAQSFFTDGPLPTRPVPPESPAPTAATALLKRIVPQGGRSKEDVQQAKEDVQQDEAIRDSFVNFGPRFKVMRCSPSEMVGEPRAPCGVESPLAPQESACSPSPPGKESRTGERPDGWPVNRLTRRPCLSPEQLRKWRLSSAAEEKSASRSAPIKLERGSMLRCVHCGYICLKQDHLDRHVKQRHGHVGRNGKYKCEWCEYSTDLAQTLSRHRLTHTGERPHRCDGCGKTFKMFDHLRRHRRTVHTAQRPHSCDVCGKAFKLNIYLTNHKRIHTGEKIRQCEQCGAKFNHVASYTRHMKFHNGVKAHRCEVCSARFVTGYQLTTHMRTHAGERPYGCTFCQARFACLANLNVHVIRRHTHDTRDTIAVGMARAL